jgi:TetR/AcrR family transcriptional repressor of lmrAB and yxaGH operons
MIDAAKDCYRRQGVSATGFTEVLDRSGAARGAIYHHFPGGKEELAAAVVESSGRNVESMIRLLGDQADSPVDAVEAFVDVCVTALEGTGGRFGCPIAPAVLDSPDSEAVLDAARTAFGLWRVAIVEQLSEFGWEPDRADQVATLVVAAVEGGFVLSRATRSAAPMREVGRAIRRLLLLELGDSGPDS